MLTQVPTVEMKAEGGDVLDLRYPPGSRVVCVTRRVESNSVRILSRGLHSAGSPVIAPDGELVLFAGKATPSDSWQVYEAPISGGEPRAITQPAGGAMDPTILSDGSVVFTSPVPKTREHTGPSGTALFMKTPTGGEPRQLTFGLAGAEDATVLADGRILFVSPGSAHSPSTNYALFTVNADGTEVAPYACQHDAEKVMRRPRELPGGRIAFVSSRIESPGLAGEVEQVLSARPFSSRSGFALTAPCRSVEPDGAGHILVTLPSSLSEDHGEGSYAVFRTGSGPGERPVLLFDDPAWHEVEAVSVRVPQRPMGRLSTVDTNRTTGLLLCLNANFSSYTSPDGAEQRKARSVRFLTTSREDATVVSTLGEVELEPDGSFLVEVPADMPLGVETVDTDGEVIRRLPPTFWVRPGENRSCIGCHEPHSRSPENRRPLAVLKPAAPVGTPGRATKPRTRWP